MRSVPLGARPPAPVSPREAPAELAVAARVEGCPGVGGALHPKGCAVGKGAKIPVGGEGGLAGAWGTGQDGGRGCCGSC